jgi:hypothetical protein
MSNSSDHEKKNLPNSSQSSYTEGDWEISVKPNMTDEEKIILERLREFRDTHNQISQEELIPISNPDKYSSED